MEESNLHMENILTSICTTPDNDPGNHNIQNLQANIPPLQNRIADLTDKIGVGYFAFDSRTPISPDKNKKRNSNFSQNNKRIRATTRNIYLSPDDTGTLCRGLTEGLNGGKLCHNLSCMTTKHPSAATGSLLPFRAYLTLPGSFILHPFPLLCYKDFSQEIIEKMKLTSITAQESAITRCLINVSPLKGQEEEILILLAL